MRVSPEHWRVFLNLAELNPELITYKFTGIQRKSDAQELWQKTINSLNALGNGRKTLKGWRKAVCDWKCKTKMKATKLRRQEKFAVGDVNPCIPLTPLTHNEKRLLKMMGEKMLEDEKPKSVQEFDLVETNAVKVEVDTTIIYDPVADHEHCEPETIEFKPSCNPSAPPSNRNKVKMAKRNRGVNTQTIKLLRKMNDNTERIANSLEKMVAVLEQFVTK